MYCPFHTCAARTLKVFVADDITTSPIPSNVLSLVHSTALVYLHGSTLFAGVSVKGQQLVHRREQGCHLSFACLQDRIGSIAQRVVLYHTRCDAPPPFLLWPALLSPGQRCPPLLMQLLLLFVNDWDAACTACAAPAQQTVARVTICAPAPRHQACAPRILPAACVRALPPRALL